MPDDQSDGTNASVSAGESKQPPAIEALQGNVHVVHEVHGGAEAESTADEPSRVSYVVLRKEIVPGGVDPAG